MIFSISAATESTSLLTLSAMVAIDSSRVGGSRFNDKAD